MNNLLKIIENKKSKLEKLVYCSCGELCIPEYEGELKCPVGDKEDRSKDFYAWRNRHKIKGNDWDLANYELILEILKEIK